jgi:hypothetical protein
MSIVQQQCPGQPEHPRHPTLSGIIYPERGPRIWATQAAAAYPESLAIQVAGAYKEGLGSQPLRKETSHTTFKVDGRDPAMEEETRRILRERENEACVGGLRAPHRSKERVPGWHRTGLGMAKVIGDFIDRRWDLMVDWYQTRGTEQAGPLPDDIVDALRSD